MVLVTINTISNIDSNQNHKKIKTVMFYQNISKNRQTNFCIIK